MTWNSDMEQCHSFMAGHRTGPMHRFLENEIIRHHILQNSAPEVIISVFPRSKVHLSDANINVVF